MTPSTAAAERAAAAEIAARLTRTIRRGGTRGLRRGHAFPLPRTGSIPVVVTLRTKAGRSVARWSGASRDREIVLKARRTPRTGYYRLRVEVGSAPAAIGRIRLR